jgi:hypothetical protein
MSATVEISSEELDRLVLDSIGVVDLRDDKLVDKGDNLATANTCFRSCAHTLCFCIS